MRRPKGFSDNEMPAIVRLLGGRQESEAVIAADEFS